MPTGVAQYYTWMNLPDGDAGSRPSATASSWSGACPAGPSPSGGRRSGPTSTGASPAPSGLVTVESHNPGDLGHNHQVLACGYDVAGSTVTVHVYDPNSGQDDDVTISFDTSAPTRATTFASNVDIGRPIRGFFRTAYAPVNTP